MAITRGRVFQMNWLSEIVCVFVGPAPDSTELFTVQFLAGDDPLIVEHKRLLAQLLTMALTTRREVEVFHGDTDSRITAVVLPQTNISPVGPAIHGDFYSITGDGIPENVEAVFETDMVSVTIVPDVWRPHWVLFGELSAAVPVGPVLVSLRAAGWQSDRVPVTVMSGPPLTLRTLYSGRPRTEPYTFVFAATPAITLAPKPWVMSGAVAADPVLTNRPGYHDTIVYCVDNLLTVTEELLRTDGLERSTRFVSIFDSTQPATTGNALVSELDPNLLEPMRDRMNAFVGRFWENPDIAFCVSGSTTHTRASAWYTTDDANRPGVSYTYDGTARTHRRFTDIPGSAAISLSVNPIGLTAIHEFGHAASDFNNGMVYDLYVDDIPPGFVVNKKSRAAGTTTIPTNFATYGTTTVQSDQNRDGIGYQAGWTSYHPALVDTTRPNMMDNYWAADIPQRCRLDRLTFAWFADRLRAKILR